jgi:hypothetical protein
MSPVLCDGDFVLVVSARVWRPDPGCVVLATHPQLGPVLKRVVSWDAAHGVSLRGENNLSSSSDALGLLPPAAISGRAWLRITPGGVSRIR